MAQPFPVLPYPAMQPQQQPAPGMIDPSSGQLTAAAQASTLEALQAKRLSDMAAALGQSAMEPLQGQMVSGHYVAPSWAQGLNKALQGYLGGRLAKLSDERTAKRLDDAAARRQAAVQSIAQAMQQGGPQLQRAMLGAAASDDPQLQKLGQQFLGKGPTSWTPGQVHTDAFGNVMEPRAAGGGKGWGLEAIGGDLYQASGSGLKKLDNAPKTSISVNASPVVMGQRAGAMEYFKHAAGQVKALGEQASNSQQLLQTLNTLQQLDQAGINSNITSDVVTVMQNLGQALGVKVDSSKLANTEAYNSLIIDLWQKAVSQNGGNRGVTAEEAAEIKKLTPMAKFSPEARQQLFQIQGAAARRNIQAYQQANESFAKAASADDPGLFQIPGLVEGTFLPPAQNLPAGAPAAVRKYNPATGRIE